MDKPVTTLRFAFNRLASAVIRILKSHCGNDPHEAASIAESVIGTESRAIIRHTQHPVNLIACEIAETTDEHIAVRAFFTVGFDLDSRVFRGSEAEAGKLVDELCMENSGKFLLEPSASMPYFEAAFVSPRATHTKRIASPDAACCGNSCGGKNRRVRYYFPSGDAVEMADPCAIINLFGDRPCLMMFDENGLMTSLGQFDGMDEVVNAIVRDRGGLDKCASLFNGVQPNNVSEKSDRSPKEIILQLLLDPPCMAALRFTENQGKQLCEKIMMRANLPDPE